MNHHFFLNEWLSACKDLISFLPNIILYCVWLEQIRHELFLDHQGIFCYIAIKIPLKRAFLFIWTNLDSLPYLCFVSSNWPSGFREDDDVKRWRDRNTVWKTDGRTDDGYRWKGKPTSALHVNADELKHMKETWSYV